MSDFKREERYIVVKLKDIDQEETEALHEFIQSWQIPTRECVVVEPDWPNYEDTWRAVEQVAKDDYQSPYAITEQQQARIDMLEEVKAEGQRYTVELEQRIAELEKENQTLINDRNGAWFQLEQEKDSHKTTYSLMLSGEKRGVEKATQELQPKIDELSAMVERLRNSLDELEQQNRELEEDLLVTQKQSSELEAKLESIENLFVDEDACLLFEPFNSENLSRYLAILTEQERYSIAYDGFVAGVNEAINGLYRNGLTTKQAAQAYAKRVKGGE